MDGDVVFFHALVEYVVQTVLNVALMAQEIANRGFPAQGEIHAIKVAGPHAGEGERGLAECLAGNSSGIGARATQFVVIVDDGDFLSERSGGGGADDTGRAAADDDEIVVRGGFRHRRVWAICFRS